MSDHQHMPEKEPMADRPPPLKPLFQCFPWEEPPRLPPIEAEQAVAMLLQPKWEDRIVENVEIDDLGTIIDLFSQKNRDPANFSQALFRNVVVRNASIAHLSIPFSLHLEDAYFLEGFSFYKCDFSGNNRLITVTNTVVTGHMSVRNCRGRFMLSLTGGRFDALWSWESELGHIEIMGSELMEAMIASSGLERGLSWHHGTVVHRLLHLENVTAQCFEFNDLHVANYLRLVSVRCTDAIRFQASEIHTGMETRNVNCPLLVLSDTRFDGRCDLTGVQFERLDASGIQVGGQLILTLGQLRQRELPRLAAVLFWAGDVPSRLVGDAVGDPAAREAAADQFFRLRENFRRIPSMTVEEDYCLYRLMENFRNPSGGFALRFLDKWLFGYLVVTRRILWTGLATMILFALLYSLSERFGWGGVSQTNDATGTLESVYSSGVGYGLFRCLYFSVITFTTVGYGDMHPVGFSKLLAMANAVAGVLLTAMFTVSLARKLLRW